MKTRSRLVGSTLMIPLALTAAPIVEFTTVDLKNKTATVAVRKYEINQETRTEQRPTDVTTIIVTNELRAHCALVTQQVMRTEDVMIPRTTVVTERVPEPAGFWKGTLVAITMPVTVPLSTLASLFTDNCDWCGQNPLLFTTEKHETTEYVRGTTQIFETVLCSTVIYEKVPVTQQVIQTEMKLVEHVVSVTNFQPVTDAKITLSALDTPLKDGTLDNEGLMQFSWDSTKIQDLKSKLASRKEDSVIVNVKCDGCETNITFTSQELEYLHKQLTETGK